MIPQARGHMQSVEIVERSVRGSDFENHCVRNVNVDYPDGIIFL